MKRALIPIVLLFILAIEGVAMELLPASIKHASIVIVPHWVLLFLVLVSAYVYPNNTMRAIILAGTFGLMIDIVYTGVLGIYMFVLALAIYIAQLLGWLLQTNFLMIILISAVSILIMELGLLMIYTVLGFSTMSFADFFIYRFSPTLLANLLFVVVIYYPSKLFLSWIDDGEIM